MTEPRMPTTLPSPVDRDEFRFLAVDASGSVWRWVDEEMVWVRDQPGSPSPRTPPTGRRRGPERLAGGLGPSGTPAIGIAHAPCERVRRKPAWRRSRDLKRRNVDHGNPQAAWQAARESGASVREP